MSVNILTLKDIRNYLITELSGLYPEQEISAITNLIIKTLFGIDRLQLLIDNDHIVSSSSVGRVIEICNELKTGKPIQYVFGETSFYNCTIKVNNETLIPRPETEELVDVIIRENKGFKGRIIDIGTGSGCIAIAIKKNLQEAEVIGIEISDGALEIAKLNAILNNVDISFIKGDIFQMHTGLIPQSGIIISNPPYVLESEKQYMNRNVIDFEPHSALFVPDEDPLRYYRAILKFSANILGACGKIYFEINEKKGLEITRILELAGYSEVKVFNDINGKNRIIKGTLNG